MYGTPLAGRFSICQLLITVTVLEEEAALLGSFYRFSLELGQLSQDNSVSGKVRLGTWNSLLGVPVMAQPK